LDLLFTSFTLPATQKKSPPKLDAWKTIVVSFWDGFFLAGTTVDGRNPAPVGR